MYIYRIRYSIHTLSLLIIYLYEKRYLKRIEYGYLESKDVNEIIMTKHKAFNRTSEDIISKSRNIKFLSRYHIYEHF